MTKKTIATSVVALMALLFSFSLADSPAAFAGGAPQNSSDGKKLFAQYCATCHGPEAKGNGPSAKALKKAPADLTKIAKVDGKFPSAKVERIISGEDMLESHGSRDMPIWGTVLRQKVGPGFAKLQIYNLVKYLETIQQ